MIFLSEVNSIIKALKLAIERTTDDEIKRNLKGNLVFYLDMRDLLQLKNCRGKIPKESEN